MKSSIKYYCIVVLAMLFTGTIFAQRGHHSPEERKAHKIERMTEELGLSEAQGVKVEAILTKYEPRIKAVRDQDGERSEKRNTIKQIHEDIKAEIKLVLTTEQAAKAETLMAERQDRGNHFKDRGDRRKKFHERKVMHDEKIKPILLKQRAKLESKISAEDKATLADLRSKFKAKKAALKKAYDSGERPSKEERKKHREEIKNSPDRVVMDELIEKYQTDIESLMAEVEPEIKAIKKEMKGKKGEDKRKGLKKGKKRHGEKGEWKGKRMTKKFAHFLLLDPTEETTSSIAPISQIANVSVYPNPSQGVSQINYNLQEAGTVLIELRDKSGNLMETIERSEKAAGTYKTSVNFGKYTVGVYYVVLIDKNGNSETVKVIR